MIANEARTDGSAIGVKTQRLDERTKIPEDGKRGDLIYIRFDPLSTG